jgi:hypothetical protein
LYVQEDFKQFKHEKIKDKHMQQFHTEVETDSAKDQVVPKK